MPRLALKGPARWFAAAMLALALVANSPAAVRSASDLIGGDAGADALAAALAGRTSTPLLASAQASASASSRPPPSFGGDAAGWERALRRDPDLKYSPSTGQLVCTCGSLADDGQRAAMASAPALPSGAMAATTAIIPTASGSGFAMPNEQDPPIANAFKLHSRPDARFKIVLDFTGHKLRNGTYWGSISKIGDVPIITPPYDLDGNPSSFSPVELAAIVSIWRQVAEDYSPWDVDVTTEEPPGTDDQGDAALIGIGQRLILGKNTGWFDQGGGVSFINTFGWNNVGPVNFVFNDFPPSTAITATHEIGHVFGLKHHGTVAKPDGTGASGYYEGHGAWAPIMGVGFGKTVIQWSKGDYDYASEPKQDDIAIISQTLPAAPFSGGGRDVQTAVLLNGPDIGATEVQTGVFTSASESHFYKFIARRPGNVSLQLSVTSKGSQGNSRTHLALKVRVVQASTNTVVGTSFDNVGLSGIDGNIPDTPTSAFAIVTAGNYYIEVAAARNGNASAGYTEYGSSGTYALSISGDAFLSVGPATPNLKCFNATTLQLWPAAGNCNSGVAVQAENIYYTLDGRTAAVSPTPGTVLTAGASRAFTATLNGETCTTTVTVVACPPPPTSADVVTCLNPSYTLAAGQCAGKAVPLAELYRLSGPGGAAPSGTATTTLPADGVLGPGKHQIVVRGTVGGASCTATVTVTPCRPEVVSTTTAVPVPSAPGVCAGTPLPSAVVSAATLGRGAVSINARTSAKGSIVPSPLKAGKYYVEVVYPGGLTSAVSSSRVLLSVTDVEDPVAAIKPAIVRDARGFMCAKGGSATSTTACVAVATTSSVINLSDNCSPALPLTLAYQCASSQNACPSSMSPTTSKLCVPVKQGGGRIEATYLLTATDKAGRKASVQIPIAGYHYGDAPAGVTCYTA